MSKLPSVEVEANTHGAPIFTLAEIVQQPLLWPTTLERVRAASGRIQLAARLHQAGILIIGAGTSAYAAGAVAEAWPNTSAIPATDILLEAKQDAKRRLADIGAVISLARSGNSPESVAVVERIREIRPDIPQFAIVCNENGALSHSGLDGLIALDPRTNDQSLVMTSAFSNLALAGLALAMPDLAQPYPAQPDALSASVESSSGRAAALLPEIERVCKLAADRVRDRIAILSSPPLLGWGREAGLKTLEMTAGRFPVLTETYLGLRHGPMSFVKRDTLVLCLLSSDPVRRLYEADLIRELRAKKIGYLVGIADPVDSGGLFDEVIPAVAPKANDALRTPFEILGPQLLGYHLSLRIGLNPDNPSPDGVINRVVQGFNIHRGEPSPR